MKRPFRRMLWCAALLCEVALMRPAQALDFTAQEREWISTNPIVVVGARNDIEPLEYVENGKLRGLAGEYLNEVARRTGLRFVLKTAPTGTIEQLGWLNDGTANMFALAAHNVETGQDRRGQLFTSPYFVSMHIIVTQAGSASMLDLEDLDGMTVAVTQYSRIGHQLRQSAPTVKVVNGGSARETLDLLAQGKVDAVVGVDALLSPIIGRRYNGILQISGVLASASTELSMAMAPDQLLLHSIVQKALSQITADEAYRMNEAWLAQTAYGEPSMSVLVRHYRVQGIFLISAVMLLVSLILAFRWAHRRAVRSEREKAKFGAVMSHEIRSPMNAVLASIELLQRTQMDGNQARLTELAGSGAQAVLRLINNVLDMSKLEAGKLVLEPMPTDLESLLLAVVESYRLRASEKGIALWATAPENCGRLLLDGDRLAQVLHNVLSNAISVTSTGHVALTASFEPDSSGTHGALLVEICDTGPGLEPAARGQLFRSYAEAVKSPKVLGAEAGLGLLISRHLVACMNGTMETRNTPGVGTTVSISLPVEVLAGEAASGDRALDRDAGGPTERALEILLVEDTPANQYVIQEQLKQLGCTAQLAQDGAQARQAFETGRYDLVLMDCDLPDTDGYVLAREFRAHETKRQIPPSSIIAISALSGSDHVSRCLDAGMDGVLSKPIQLGRLRDTIEIWCGVTLVDRPDTVSDDLGLSVSPPRFIHNALVEDLGLLRRALAEGDAVLARHYAHRLRGACLTLGMRDLAQLAARMEELLNADPDSGRHDVTQIWESMDDALKQAIMASKENG